MSHKLTDDEMREAWAMCQPNAFRFVYLIAGMVTTQWKQPSAVLYWYFEMDERYGGEG